MKHMISKNQIYGYFLQNVLYTSSFKIVWRYHLIIFFRSHFFSGKDSAWAMTGTNKIYVTRSVCDRNRLPKKTNQALTRANAGMTEAFTHSIFTFQCGFFDPHNINGVVGHTFNIPILIQLMQRWDSKHGGNNFWTGHWQHRLATTGRDQAVPDTIQVYDGEVSAGSTLIIYVNNRGAKMH